MASETAGGYVRWLGGTAMGVALVAATYLGIRAFARTRVAAIAALAVLGFCLVVVGTAMVEEAPGADDLDDGETMERDG